MVLMSSDLFFERDEHTYYSPTFQSVVEEVIDFLEETPAYSLPLSDRFSGPGVYVLYYRGDFEPYGPISHGENERLSQPIYVGKAVPKGRRQGRSRSSDSAELYKRISEHRRSIDKVENLDPEDFLCRFVILEQEMSDTIVTVESALVRKHKPLWNSGIDGFGNHDPGSGRYDQKPSQWDTLHPGRSWVEKLKGESRDRSEVIEQVQDHIS
jgi:hypothetical protein